MGRFIPPSWCSTKNMVTFKRWVSIDLTDMSETPNVSEYRYNTTRASQAESLEESNERDEGGVARHVS